ncbi:MAG: hypothetical protein M3O30_15415 [Planctomycetota bacterium]|nr:hypothetical protein [Planctomycetota bacterium]
MSHIRGKGNRLKLMAAASAASVALVSSAFGQSNVGAGQIVISAAGSTALKNWIVAKTTTFTQIQPGTALSINGVTYPTIADGGTNYWTVNGGPGVSYQLAPKNNTTVQGTAADSSAAIQFVYHESGAVEGPLELVNDQLYTNSNYAPASGIASTSIPYITANIDRNPEGGNAVWLNYNQIGASGTTAGAAFNATSGANAGNGLTLGNFYGPGVGQASTAGTTNTWVPGSASNPTPKFDQAGANLNGGQNAVQFALSDSVPQQAFKNDYGNITNTFVAGGSTQTQTGSTNHSFNAKSIDLGYGAGNSALTFGSLGTAGDRQTYQSPSLINVSATAQNPRAAQGTAFGAGPWTNAANGGLGNLNNTLTAVTATPLVSNPGTGLIEINRTDAAWLQLSSRLQNGASFNMSTRDTGSGTRNDFANNTGVDPSWAAGKNDSGNGNLPNGVNNAVFDQESIGPAQRFSNKTAGGAQLRPTVQNNRMAVGTLSINDAGGNDRQGLANPVRALSYADTATGYANPVSPNYATISNGTFALYQNEEVFTVKDMSSTNAYNNSYVYTAANGSQLIHGTIQGDNANGDVVTVLNNTGLSVATAASASTPANPADGLLSQGYIIPSLMQVKKNIDGQGLINTPGQVDTGRIVSQSNLPVDGGSFNQSLYNSYSAAGGFGPSALPDLTSQQPTTGTGSTYGGKGATFARSFYNGGAIAITDNNYLFGNFNQNSDRDFNAVKSALAAAQALISADQAVSASVPGSEFTAQGDNNLNWNGPASLAVGGTNGVSNATPITYTDALGIAHTTLTKGDLIVMGDFAGAGHFDGASLVAMAEGASLSDSTGTDRLTSSATMYQGGVLNKNAAMDYMNTNVGTITAADQYIRSSGRAILEAASIPSGATAVTNAVSGQAVIDPVTGLSEFSFDPTGVNTFNKSDINRDGVVDFNDAVLTDNNNGMDYTNLNQQVGAIQPAPVTGATIPLNLVMVKQSDGSTVIGASDVAVVNTALTGAGNANWYNFNVQKTGPGTLDWERTGGTVRVYGTASFQVSAGNVKIGGTVDPFTDSSVSTQHVALAIDSGGTVTLAQGGGTTTVSSLTMSNLAAGSKLDIANNSITVAYGTNGSPNAAIKSYVTTGYNIGGTLWSGNGITSSLADVHHSVAFADGSDGVVQNLPAGKSSAIPGGGMLPAGNELITYTFAGDANIDGKVDFADFVILSNHFGGTFTNWDQGNFNYDSGVDFADFVILSNNFGEGVTGNGTGATALQLAQYNALATSFGISASQIAAWDHQIAALPEPTSLGLIAIGAMGLLPRRRRATNKNG